MRLLKDYKKCGATEIKQGILEGLELSNSKETWQVRKFLTSREVRENYGSGGWIEGSEIKRRPFQLLKLYQNNEFKGFIVPGSNAYFRDPKRYNIVLTENEELVNKHIELIGEKVFL